jgi:hypothetical protein
MEVLGTCTVVWNCMVDDTELCIQSQPEACDHAMASNKFNAD